VQISRLPDGSRRVTSVTEVTGMEGQTVTMQDLFLLRREGVDADGKIAARLAPTGLRPHHMERFVSNGFELPISMFAGV
jgi:pilus assembly protein CpaF